MNAITVQVTVSAPVVKIWQYWNEPRHITGWAFASDDWEAPAVENDIRVGGKFKTVMAAKDGSSKFDFTGTYTAVRENAHIEYDIDGNDGQGGATRHVNVDFFQLPDGVKITETFDPETENSEEIQRSGWQAILNNFKKYVDSINQ